MLILNEKKYAEDLYVGKNDEIKSIVAKVGYITRYLMHVKKINDNENYNKTVDWMNEHHDNFDESCYSKLISDAIKKAHKKPFFNIENIKITKNELNVISSLNDLRSEKVLFVLLCMAKQQREVYGFTNGLVKYSLPDLCKMARISVPTDDREYILYNIVQNGYLSYPNKNNTSCLMVNFIDDGEKESEFVVNEIDCQELAYTYLNWKNNGHGYTRCELCKRFMKKSKKTINRYCRECAEIVGDIPDDIKVVECDDCGKLVYVSILNSKTCRCEECQIKRDEDLNRKASRERMRRYRENK